MQTFPQIIAEHRAIIHQDLERHLYPDLTTISDSHNKLMEQFHQALCFDYPNRGGKYIRSIFCMLSAEAMGVDRVQTITTATALEICQNWLLIHDDIEDDSAERRGQPTLHRKYNTPLAINAGDTLHLLMWKILRDNETLIGSQKTFRIMDEFHQMLWHTSLGQTTELEYIRQAKFDISVEDYFYLVDHKTSYYTIAGPLRLAGILALPDDTRLHEEIFPQMNVLGRYLGRMFQLIDDILDLTSDFDGLKNQQGNDIYESKHTLLVAHLLSQVSVTEQADILAILTKPRANKTPNELHYIINRMQETGTIEHVRQLARSYAHKAKTVLADMDFLLMNMPDKNFICVLSFY